MRPSKSLSIPSKAFGFTISSPFSLRMILPSDKNVSPGITKIDPPLVSKFVGPSI